MNLDYSEKEIFRPDKRKGDRKLEKKQRYQKLSVEERGSRGNAGTLTYCGGKRAGQLPEMRVWWE